MNANKYLQSFGVIFPKDCSFENLQLLDDLHTMPVFEYYDENGKWIVDYILSDVYRYSCYKTRPLDSKCKKTFLSAVERVIAHEINPRITYVLNMAVWLVNSRRIYDIK